MPGGRPTKYVPAYAKTAQKLCRLGATDQEIAEFFEVHVATLNRWKTTHEEFCASLKTGKEESDERVERSLYHKAIGYTFDSEKIFNNGGEIVRAKTKEHVPPDTTAAIFWLKNRRPDLWRDKKEFDVRNRDLAEGLSDEELARIARTSGNGVAKKAGSKAPPDTVH